MALVQYILRLLSAFHLSGGRDDDPADLEDLPRSDTLVSAILSVWDRATSATAAEIEALAVEPPFVLSSAMPTLERNQRFEVLLFLPVCWSRQSTRDDGDFPKSYRRARFATVESLRALAQGRALPSDALLVSDRGSIVAPAAPGAFDSNPTIDSIWRQHLWRREVTPRVAVDRFTAAAAEGVLFRYGSTYFRKDVYLTVLAEFHDPSYRPTFETALRILGMEGIGGGRSIGRGRFELHRVIDGFEPQLGSGRRLLLSLMHPTKAEILQGLLASPAAYSLVGRGGWAELNGIGVNRRQTVNLLAEGSLVCDLGASRYGNSVCTLRSNRLPYAVYRCGCALTLPLAWRNS